MKFETSSKTDEQTQNNDDSATVTRISTIVIGTGDDMETLLDFTLDDVRYPGDNSVERIRFIRGGARHTSDKIVELHQTGQGVTSVLATEHEAIGYLLSYLEQHDISEESARRVVTERVDLEAHDEWQASMGEAERRNRLLQNANEHAEGDMTATKALEVGTWRSTDLDPGAKEVVSDLIKNTKRNGQRCYETAQRAIKHAWDNDRVKYCEGYALPATNVRGTRHAWVEVDGAVVELTWPWHMPVDGTAEYYGTEIPRSTLRRRMNHPDRRHDPMLLTEEEWDDYLQKIKATRSGVGA